jgi:itaconate CoA-transferase
MSQDTVTRAQAETACATAPNAFASEYGRRLTTAAEAMDADGNFSFGTNSDYSVVMFRRCQRIVVEVNRRVPRVHGPAQIHVSEVAAIVENDTPLEVFPVAPPKDLDPVVARNSAGMRSATVMHRFGQRRLCSTTN